jgi:Skp family chaperone for outer membrane proteins
MRCTVRAALGALAFITIGTAGAAAQSSPPKIAYINSQAILAQAPGRAEAEATLQKEMDGYKTQVQQMEDSLNTMIDAYQKVQAKLSDSAKAKREKAIRDKQASYQQRTQALQQQAQQHEQELIRPIMAQIDSVIEKIRAEDGYAMVFDAGSQSGVIVAADSALDITPKVIARLKAASTAKAPSKPGDTPDQKPSGAQANPAGVKPKVPSSSH